MTEALERDYQIRRGDFWPGEAFRLKKANSSGFWSSPKVRAQLRPENDTSRVAYEFSISPVTSVDGIYEVLSFSISIPASDAERLVPGKYVGDVEVTSSGLARTTLISFTAEVFADATR